MKTRSKIALGVLSYFAAGIVWGINENRKISDAQERNKKSLITERKTKAEVKAECESRFRHPSWPYSATDVTAKREFWNDYTDELHKDGQISELQYSNWTNPF